MWRVVIWAGSISALASGIAVNAQDPVRIIRDHRKSSAAAPAVIPDVKQAFDRVQEKRSRLVTFANRTLLSSMPSGFDGFPRYHQQGVQKLPSGGFVVSGSTPTGNSAYFYVTDAAGTVINVTTIESGAFSHAGGIQVCGTTLAVGVENPSDSGAGSRVHFYDLANPAQPRKLALVINRHRETAGAVGLVQTPTGYTCVVGNYNSKRLDFYRFINPDQVNGGRMRRFGREISEGGWEAYQNLNLFTDARGGLWIVGMHTNKVSFGTMMKDWADLWRVDVNANEEFRLSKEGKKHHVSSTDGSRFLYGSGYCYNPRRRQFEVFSVEACMNRSGVSRGASWNL